MFREYRSDRGLSGHLREHSESESTHSTKEGQTWRISANCVRKGESRNAFGEGFGHSRRREMHQLVHLIGI